MMTDDECDAWLAGWRAYEDGKTVEDSPYESGSLLDFRWQDGYSEAYHDMLRREEGQVTK